jgi:hypothetical protein
MVERDHLAVVGRPNRRSNALLIKGAERCLKQLKRRRASYVSISFWRSDEFSSMRALLEEFHSASNLQGFRELIGLSAQEIVDHARRTIEAMKEAKITTFNPFIVSGFSPDENEWTLTLSKLFDPSSTHGFGIELLCALLSAVRPEAARRGLIQTLETILTAARSEPSKIEVRQNFYHEFGLPDIVISGGQAVKFLIIIENKKRGGGETMTARGVQSSRYREILGDLAIKIGIQPDCCLAIYLTPEGKNANDTEFLPLASHDLAYAMLSVIDTNQSAPLESRHLTRAFLMTYSWLN